MYGLPPDFDATVLVGAELTQVSFSANTVHLVLDPDVQITIVGAFSLQVNAHMPLVLSSPPVDSSAIMALIGKRVSSAIGSRDGTLTLKFENGGTIFCLDDSEEYEAYTIQAHGKTIVV